MAAVHYFYNQGENVRRGLYCGRDDVLSCIPFQQTKHVSHRSLFVNQRLKTRTAPYIHPSGLVNASHRFPPSYQGSFLTSNRLSPALTTSPSRHNTFSTFPPTVSSPAGTLISSFMASSIATVCVAEEMVSPSLTWRRQRFALCGEGRGRMCGSAFMLVFVKGGKIFGAERDEGWML